MKFLLFIGISNFYRYSNLNILLYVQSQGGLDLNALNLGTHQGANTTSQITTM